MRNDFGPRPFDFASRRWWLRGLIAFDIACSVFIVGYVLFPVLRPYWYLHTSFDLSVPEFVQYAKALGAAILLFRAGKHHRSLLFYFLGAVYVYLALDDSLMLHERIGGQFLGPLLFDTPVEAYQKGQLLYAVLFLAVVTPLLILFVRRARPEVRRAALYFAGTLTLLGATAVALDFCGDLITNPWLGLLVGIVEELGEALAMTFAFWLALVLKRPGGKSPDQTGVVLDEGGTSQRARSPDSGRSPLSPSS